MHHCVQDEFPETWRRKINEVLSRASQCASAAGFPAATREQWQTLVAKVLKGADFERRLVSRTADGLRIEPLYTRADAVPGVGEAAPGKAPFIRGTAVPAEALGWQDRIGSFEVGCEADFVVLDPDATRRDVEQFLLAFDSDLAPIVGKYLPVASAAGRG